MHIYIAKAVVVHFFKKCNLSWELRDSSHGVAYRGGSTVVTMGPARDCTNGDTSVYPGSEPSRVEVKPLLPACFVLTRQYRLQCSSSCSG
jgi:hypothetical protein